MRRETQLLRQVHPQFVQQGQPSSQVFRPTPKDEKLLSVYDGDQIGPGDAFEHYTNRLGLASTGILAVTVGECETCELQSRPDPEAFPEHEEKRKLRRRPPTGPGPRDPLHQAYATHRAALRHAHAVRCARPWKSANKKVCPGNTNCLHNSTGYNCQDRAQDHPLKGGLTRLLKPSAPAEGASSI